MKPIPPRLLLAPLLLITSFATNAAEPADDRWSFELMTGVGVAPRYSGSKDVQPVPVVSFEATSPKGWFFNVGEIGWSTQFNERATMRAYVGASGVRYDKNNTFGGSDYLRGMGDIKTRAMVGVGGSYAFGMVVLSGNFKHVPKDNKRGDNGLATQQAEFSLQFPLATLAGGHLLGSVSGEYGNSGYMQTWYGVSAAQAARTGFAQHTPKAGLASAGAGISWVRPAGEQSQWLLSLEGTRLLGDAGKSPVVQQKTQMTMTAAWLRSF